MQAYSCICMYMYVKVCICMNMQLYVWICLRTRLMRPFFSCRGASHADSNFSLAYTCIYIHIPAYIYWCICMYVCHMMYVSMSDIVCMCVVYCTYLQVYTYFNVFFVRKVVSRIDTHIHTIYVYTYSIRTLY
jgi:hypothetical protein